jgi:hypothetical protein
MFTPLFRSLSTQLATVAVILLSITLIPTTVFAQDKTPQASVSLDNDQSLDQALQALKKDVLALNRDLFILEEELLFPTNTQVAVFLSLDVGEFFKLDAVTLTIDNKEVSSHLYTDRQLDALVRGGVQRVYLGNIKSGEHEVVAVFTGRGPNNRDFRRAASLSFNKTSLAKKLELIVKDEMRLYQPKFSIVEWD